MQDGIEPMWEDERNKRGGRWLLTLNKQQRKFELDHYWLETVGLAVAAAFTLSCIAAEISDQISHLVSFDFIGYWQRISGMLKTILGRECGRGEGLCCSTSVPIGCDMLMTRLS